MDRKNKRSWEENRQKEIKERQQVVDNIIDIMMEFKYRPMNQDTHDSLRYQMDSYLQTLKYSSPTMPEPVYQLHGNRYDFSITFVPYGEFKSWLEGKDLNPPSSGS